VANRELARIREMNLDEVTMPESMMEDEIEGLLEPGDNETIEMAKAESAVITSIAAVNPRKQLIRNRITAMNPTFKREIAYIAVNGTSEEKERLRNRVNEFTMEENREMGLRLYNKIKAGQLDNGLIRTMLMNNAELKEILKTQM
jgi:hypothetical protein